MQPADLKDSGKGGREEIVDLEQKYLFPTYSRSQLFVSHGSGIFLWDIYGKKYRDFVAGIAVNALGYNHPRFVRVLQEQGAKLIHVSNLYYHPYQGMLAKRLAEISGMSKVFFTNSGTEAMEAALKIARAHAYRNGPPGKQVFVSLKNSFHGRTLGSLSVTGQPKYQIPFRPLLEDVRTVEDLTQAGLERVFDDRVCALIMEPIQGEGGIVPVPGDLLRAARELCDRHGALLILDEIQSGLGRTGRYFAFQHHAVQPDLLTLAKSLAGGFPLGAVLGGERVAGSLKAGDHGSTFAGGPLGCRLALEFLNVLEEEDLLKRATEIGAYLVAGIEGLRARHATIREIRGLGLMLGVDLGGSAKKAAGKLLERGFIANVAHETVLRLLPPFIVTREDVDAFVSGLDEVLTEIESEGSE